MALELKNIYEDEYLYRCDCCGFEHPLSSVKKHEIGPPPPHHCKQSMELQFNREGQVQ